MQRGGFYEESAVCANANSQSKWYKVFTIVFYVFVAIILIQVLFSFSYVASMLDSYSGVTLVVALIQWFGFIIAVVLLAVLALYIRKRFNVSFDYSFVENELRVSKVFNGKKRKHLKRFQVDFILKIGWASKPSFERTAAGYQKRNIVFYTPNKEPMQGKDFYYIVYSTSTEKKIYIIEARQELLEYLVLAAGVNKLERE